MATNTNAQTFDFETMAVVLYAMAESGVTLGMKHYEMMAKADGTRGKDGFNHQFRKVKARAKELQEQAKNGTLGDGKAAPAKPAANGGGKQAPVKRARKAKAETEGDESPTKKAKTEKERSGDGADAEGDDVSA